MLALELARTSDQSGARAHIEEAADLIRAATSAMRAITHGDTVRVASGAQLASALQARVGADLQER